MLKRCIYGQALDRHKTLPFHGDETYRFPGYELFNAGRDINDWVCLETRSADSAFEFVAAAEALAEMLGGPEGARLRALAEQVRAATESLYWQSELGFYAPSRSDFAPTVHHYPFANINLRPLWVGYGKASDPRQAQNVLASLRYLWRGNGLVKTTPFCGYYVGMTPGYVVWNLAELRHPAVTKALKGMLDCAEGSGGYAEMIEPDDRPASEVWGLHRARPWEGGINAEAAIHAITGYEPDAPRGRASLRPLLVAGSSLRVRRLPLGNMAISFSLVESRPGHRVYRIEVEGPQPARASVDLAVVVWGSGLRLGRIEAKNSAQVHPAPGPSWPWAQELHIDGLEVTPDYPAVVSVSYTPAPATASLPTAVAFAYPQPNLPGGVRAIVVTPSADKVQEAQARYGSVWAVDTKIPWPPDYLRAALISSGRPRVASVILDVDGFPGAFKRREFWTKGEGRRIIDEYKNCGGRVENVLRPSPPPKPRAALPALSASPSHVTTTTQPEPLSSAPASADR
ncbi:MAG: hypothetical protein H5T86_14175 [Armatimonadetes bacterium]|nr:hypothetical protein [Armatimonadota bacterium]